jgi:glycine/D-amino acid oxidase-like deaminating enzyme
MGHIVVMDDSEAQFALTRYSQTLWDELEPRLPSNVEFERCGTLWVAAGEEEMREVRRKCAFYRERRVKVEILDSKGVREAEPNLRTPLAGGLFVPGDSVLYPPCAAAFLLGEACVHGAQLRVGQPVVGIACGRANLADGTVFTASFIINAAGQSAPKLVPKINIRPRKGHLVITDRYPGFIHHQLIELGYLKSAHLNANDSVAFNVQPRKTGQLLIGSSRQYAAEDKGVDPRILSRMLNRAFEYVPALASVSATRVWTGFRAATPDKLPLIGPWPGDPTIFLAAGHEGLGITTSLATGRIVADQVLGRNTGIPSGPYLPSRQMEAEVHA